MVTGVGEVALGTSLSGTITPNTVYFAQGQKFRAVSVEVWWKSYKELGAGTTFGLKLKERLPKSRYFVLCQSPNDPLVRRTTKASVTMVFTGKIKKVVKKGTE